jgi:hypothetical protein
MMSEGAMLLEGGRGGGERRAGESVGRVDGRSGRKVGRGEEG